ncbi:tetratricopeptide repeat protein [Flavobacterium agrisoli]|uniref:Tetratricopeptide repeat protein n=1 Tax=Flavobacterium agrisoli TaxID=2793066 RepID=A0A934UJ42_9FLAO|nr:tetratricopeptide repeat protein [Flavobacterium agrisoli]MBK0369571.1 tetratricopeptide repeat protein [Flavobacterium agrisoli]
MKNIRFLFLLITQVFFAQSGFENGNNLYKNGKYQEALTAYESVLKNEKVESADLYFNIANCNYRLNKVAPAIYNYEKALVLRPNDPTILNNLKFAKKLTIDEIKEVPKVGFAKLLENFTGIFTYNTWAWVAVGFAFAFLLCFVGYYFSETTLAKRWYFITMFVMLFLMVLALFAGISEKTRYENDRPAIVFAEMTEVHSEPQKAASAIFVLHEGTKVYVKETVDKWKKIELTDGSEGWINSADIKEVKKP